MFDKMNLSLEDTLEEFQDKIFRIFTNKKTIRGVICGSDIKSLILISTLQHFGFKINQNVLIIIYF